MADFASKTAKASIKAGMMAPKDTPVLSDTERVRLIRIECTSNIYPSNENAHALLREYDKALIANAGLSDQLRKLADFIMANVPGEPSQNEGAVDCAIRIIDYLQDQVSILKDAAVADGLAFNVLQLRVNNLEATNTR